MLERLLAGVSPAAKRALTIALMAVGWIGFLIAVFGGLVPGLIFIVLGFALCWFAASMLASKPATRPAQEAGGDSAAHPVESSDPADIEARVKRRLESMKQENPEADG